MQMVNWSWNKVFTGYIREVYHEMHVSITPNGIHITMVLYLQLSDIFDICWICICWCTGGLFNVSIYVGIIKQELYLRSDVVTLA